MIHLATNQGKRLTWIMIGIIVVPFVLMLSVAVLRAASDDDAKLQPGGQLGVAPTKVLPKGESLISPKPTGQANLGSAPQNEAYGPAFQAKVEKSVQELIADNKKREAEFKNALADTNRAHEERIVDLTSQWEKRMAAGNPNGVAVPLQPTQNSASIQEKIEKTRVVLINDVSDPTTLSPGKFVAAPSDVVPSPGTTTEISTAPVTPSAAGVPPEPVDAFVIPEAGFAEGIMLNGVVARANASEFVYTTIKLRGNYTSANDFKQNVDSCVVTGEARAAYAEGRVRIKPVKLTCTLPTGRTRSWKTSGYVVDAADAIEGVVATISDNQAKRVGAVTAASILEGIGNVATAGQSTNVYNPSTGQATSVITGNLGRAVGGGAISGAGHGLRDEVRQYFDLLQPTVQVGGGGKVTVFLQTEAVLPEGGDAFSTVRSANPKGQ